MQHRLTKLTAATENARTLAAALGLGEEQAADLLNVAILVTSSNEAGAQVIAADVVSILSRTFADVGTETRRPPVVEVVIGAAQPRSTATVIWVSTDASAALVSKVRPDQPTAAKLHGALAVVVACYASSSAAAAAVPGLGSCPDTVEFAFADLGLPPRMWTEPVELGGTYLAGAGAVGNGFLWSLRHFDVRGRLGIVDPDDVSSGNLNRQIWFGEDDVEKPKAFRLAMRAQPAFPHLKLLPVKAELQELAKREQNPRWLKRLVVGVDSRRVRRHLQGELPREVYDASTTGIEEVVLHFNRQPNTAACLGCIYHETPRERAREEHVAEALGVSITDVASGRVSADAAMRISARYSLEPASIEGIAYDSLFKELCSQKALMVEGQQVLAPFAFVSVLAGAFLAIELVARLIDPARHGRFNYWRVSPWRPFRVRQWRLRGRHGACDVCGNPHVQAICDELWGVSRRSRADDEPNPQQ